jgi:hypothetical protein
MTVATLEASLAETTRKYDTSVLCYCCYFICCHRSNTYLALNDGDNDDDDDDDDVNDDDDDDNADRDLKDGDVDDDDDDDADSGHEDTNGYAKTKLLVTTNHIAGDYT